MGITVFTKDENNIVSGNAVDDQGNSYTQSQITKLRVIYSPPRNRATKYPAVLIDWVSPGTDADNSFHGIIPGLLPIEGYWEIRVEMTLASSGKPVHSPPFHLYVGHVPDTDGTEVDGRIPPVIANSLTLDGQTLLLDGNVLVLN